MGMYNYDNIIGNIIAPCKCCGEINEIKAWYNLNSKKDPIAKRKLIKNELFKYECKKCGTKYLLGYEMMYHDVENKVIIYLDPMMQYTKQIKKKIKKQKKELGKDYRFRIVKNISSLREKAVFFEHKYDDKVIEMMVGELIVNTNYSNKDITLERVDFNVDDAGLEVILSGVDKNNKEIEIPNYVDYNTYKVNERNTYLLFKLKESLFIDFDWCIEQRKKNKKRIERKMRKCY